MSPELSAFIAHAREKGMDHATIRQLLLSAGWKEKDIARALVAQSLDLPVPTPPDTGGAREAFLHLLTFASFYTAAIAVVVLIFQYLDFLFPDPATARNVSPTRALAGIRWSLAMVIVAFPVFLWLGRYLLREMRAHPERAWSGTRRWLTYMTLFLAAVALGVDLMTLVFRLLEGELSLRFVSKVLVIVVVAGLAFVYYVLSLRMSVESIATTRMHRGFATAACVVAVGTVVWGFAIVGSPVSERARKFDERRIEDLETIRDEIVKACLGDNRRLAPDERKLLRPLPQTLEEVVESARGKRPDVRDPETGEPYGYEVVDDTRFRVCATFNFERDEAYGVAWNHPAGQHCFQFDALQP